MKKFLLFFCLWFFFLYSPSFCEEINNSFFIGAIRTDGVLIPFAHYDSGTWSSPWPSTFYPDFPDSRSKSLNDSTITTLSKIPPAWAGSQKKIPVRWWKLGTQGYSSLTVTRPVIVASYCAKLWALLLSGRKPPQDSHSYEPLTGIATSVKLPVSKITTVRPNSPEWKKMFPFIQSLVDKKEIEKGSRLSEKVRRAGKMTVSMLFRNESVFLGEYYYFFEVKKEYPLPKYDQNNYLYWGGWIRKDKSGGLTFLKDEFFTVGVFENSIAQEDIPLGIITLEDTMYWIIDDRGYEGEACRIYRIGGDGITKVIDFYIGGC